MADRSLWPAAPFIIVALCVYASHAYAQRQAYKTGVYIGKAAFTSADFQNRRCRSLHADSVQPDCEVNDLNNELEDVLRPIAMNACRLDLFSQIQNDSRAAVFWKGAQVPHNQDSGWDSDHNGSEIVLHGTWCTNLIAEGPAALEVIPDCNPRP